MKKRYENIDDLFRDKFESFELDPPDHVWENIKTEISKSNTGGGGSIGGNGITGFIALIITLGGLLVFLSSPTSSEKATDLIAFADLPEEQIMDDNSESLISSSVTVDIVDEAITAAIIDEEQGDAVNTNLNNKITNGIAHNPNPRPISTSEINPNEESDNELDVENNLVFGTSNERNNKFRLNLFGKHRNAEVKYRQGINSRKNVNALDNRSPEQNKYKVSDGNYYRSAGEGFDFNGKNFKNTYAEPARLSFGVFFTPEAIDYGVEGAEPKRSYSFDIHGIWQKSGLLVQSGLGLAFTEDDGGYTLNFEKYLGQYEDVYDITFDSTENGIIPIYHTQTVEVYDSIAYISVSTTKNRYTYLQIPLLIGYGNESRRLSWFIKGGPTASLLVNKKIPDINYPYEHIRILAMDEQMPERIRLHWQMMLSAGLSYRLSNHLSIVFEPVFRYYLKSAYDRANSENKLPYSYGIRTGFLVNF